MELSWHTNWTEKVSSRICKSVQEEIPTTPFHMDVVILLTPLCCQVEDTYPPCSGFDRIVHDTALVLKQLGTLTFTNVLNSAKSLVVFEERGILCCQTLSCYWSTTETNPWSRFEQESFKLLEQKIEQVYIPYIQSNSCWRETGVDLYDLLVLDSIYGGSVELETDTEVYRRLLLITLSPATLSSCFLDDEEKNVTKFMNRKGIVLDLVHVSSVGLEEIPNSVVSACLCNGGFIVKSKDIPQIGHILCNSSRALYSVTEPIGSEMEYSLQSIISQWFSCENYVVVVTSEQWRYCGKWLGVFIQWHIQQGFRIRHQWIGQEKTTNSSCTVESCLPFYLLLDERSLVVCLVYYMSQSGERSDITTIDCVCPDTNETNTMDFVVQLEWRRIQDDRIGMDNGACFHRWRSLLACEKILFETFMHPTTRLSFAFHDWWKECPCLTLFILLKCTARNRGVPVIEQVENILLSLYPGSTCCNHFVTVRIQQSQYLLFSLVPVVEQGVKVTFVGMGLCVHQWKCYLDPLFRQDEWQVWSFHLEASMTCSFFLLQVGKRELTAVESLNFVCNNSKVRIRLWEEPSHYWIFPCRDAAQRVWQLLYYRLENTMEWTRLRLDNQRKKTDEDNICWWIGANYPLVVGLERKKNRINMYNHHKSTRKEPFITLFTAIANYYALDVVWDWWRLDQQYIVENTKHIVKIDDCLWNFAKVMYHYKMKSRLVESENVHHFDKEWIMQVICQHSDWMPMENGNSNKILHRLIGEEYIHVASEWLTLVKKMYWHDSNKNSQWEWLVGLVVQVEFPFSLFILSLQPMEWISDKEESILRSICRQNGSCIVQQIQRNILWNCCMDGKEINEWWMREETKNWKSVRWLWNDMWSEDNDCGGRMSCISMSFHKYIPYAMEWLVEMLCSCGYHPLPCYDECKAWLWFQYKTQKEEYLRVVAKVYRNEAQLWLELYDMAPELCTPLWWLNWIRFHHSILKILGKYVQLHCNYYCCFSGWIQLDDISIFCKEYLRSITDTQQPASVLFRDSIQVLEWRQQNVWLLKWKHTDMSTLCLDLQVVQNWPLECVVSFDQVSKYCENVSFSQFFWFVLHIEYLQGKYIVEQWFRSDIPMENKVISKWLFNEDNNPIEEVRNQGVFFRLHSMEMEWKYPQVSKMDLIEECKRQLEEKQLTLYVKKNSHQLACAGLVTVHLLQQLSKETLNHTTDNNWIVFILEMSQWKSNDCSVVAKIVSLPPLSDFHKSGNRILECLQELEQNVEEFNKWLRNWYSSVLFHLHQLQRWKIEMEICTTTRAWNRHLFMDTFPHFPFSELCRRHFSSFDDHVVKIPKLPRMNQSEWDKIMNPSSLTFSDTFQLLKRNEPGECHVWYLLISPQRDNVMLLLHLPMKQEPELELIMQSTAQMNDALHLGCQFVRWLIRQIWSQCWTNWHNLQVELNNTTP